MMHGDGDYSDSDSDGKSTVLSEKECNACPEIAI
jgi:hypothetical protein